MDKNTGERKKSILRAVTAEKLTEMLKEIDVSSSKGITGEYSARARITALFDRGTFCEVGTYINRSSDPDSVSGIICGYGAVGGRLVFALAHDRARMNGAFDESCGRKIKAVCDMALKNGAPIIGIFDSDGINVYEGVRALAALGRTFKSISLGDGIIPRIAVVPGVCGGTAAAIASSFDFLFTVKGKESEVFAVSPFVSGISSDETKNALSAVVSENEDSLYSDVRRLISFLPSNNEEGTVIHEETELNRPSDVSGLSGESLVAELTDNRDYIRLYTGASSEVVAGFGFIGGVATAYIANNVVSRGGVLTSSGLRVCSRIQNFAGAFGMPLIMLVDCPGFDDGDSDPAAYIETASSFAEALLCYPNPKIQAVVGRAYGVGFTLMGSKSMGADIAFAIPSACISALSPESSVALVWNDRIRASDLSATREMLEREWREKLSSPNEAAIAGEIDDIVPENELRARIASSLQMLRFKTRSAPSRR